MCVYTRISVLFVDTRIHITMGSFLSTLGEYYENQNDALSMLVSWYSKENPRNQNLNTQRLDLWAALYGMTTWNKDDWKHVRKEVKLKMNSVECYLTPVYTMFLEMGYTSSQAVQFVHMLCSDKSISENTRQNLVTYWSKLKTLESFNDSVIPLQDTKNTIATSKKALHVEFRLLMASCLPLNNSQKELKEHLANTHIAGCDSARLSELFKLSGVNDSEAEAILVNDDMPTLSTYTPAVLPDIELSGAGSLIEYRDVIEPFTGNKSNRRKRDKPVVMTI